MFVCKLSYYTSTQQAVLDLDHLLLVRLETKQHVLRQCRMIDHSGLRSNGLCTPFSDHILRITYDSVGSVLYIVKNCYSVIPHGLIMLTIVRICW